MARRKPSAPMTLNGEAPDTTQVPDVDREALGDFGKHARVSTRRPLMMMPPEGAAQRIFGIRLMPAEDDFLRQVAKREQRSKHEVTRALLLPAVEEALVLSQKQPGLLSPRRAKPGIHGPQISVKLTDAELEKLRQLSAMENRSQQQVVRSVFLPALERELGQTIPEISDD